MSHPTYSDLLAQKKSLQEQIDLALESERTSAITRIRIEMAELGITVSDLTGTRVKKATVKRVAAKYRDPDTGKEWSGRGKPPTWIAGQDRAKYLIQY